MRYKLVNGYYYLSTSSPVGHKGTMARSSNTSVLSSPSRVTRRHPKRHNEEEEELGDVECGSPCVEDVGKQHVTCNTRNNFMFSDRERNVSIPGRVGHNGIHALLITTSTGPQLFWWRIIGRLRLSYAVALTFFRSLKTFRLTFLRMRNKCKIINVQRNNKAFSV